MDKWQAIHSFWSGFGLPAYDENSVPSGKDAPVPPYITYSASVGNLDKTLTLTASLWYRSTSWKEISQKADEIAETLGIGGYTVDVDGGYLYLVMGTPFAQRMSEVGDDTMKRIYLNVNAEFLTEF